MYAWLWFLPGLKGNKPFSPVKVEKGLHELSSHRIVFVQVSAKPVPISASAEEYPCDRSASSRLGRPFFGVQINGQASGPAFEQFVSKVAEPTAVKE